MSRWILVAAVAVVVVVAVAIADTHDGQYEATAACAPPRTPQDGAWLAGWRRTPNATVGGVYADIINYDPYVYPYGAYNASSGWVMVTTSNGLNYAQIGWYKEAVPVGPPIYAVFREWTTVFNNPNSWTRRIHFLNPPIGSNTYYTVLYNNTPGKFTFIYSGAPLGNETAVFTPNVGEIFAENHNRASQMPGGVNNHEVFNDSSIWFSSSWKSFNGAPLASDGNIHASQKLSGWVDHVWDKQCTA